MSHIEAFLNLATTFALLIALTIFTILMVKLRRRERSTLKSLRFQLSIVIVLMLVAELSLLVPGEEFGSYLSSPGSSFPTTFETFHSIGMGFFAALMTWRGVKYLR